MLPALQKQLGHHQMHELNQRLTQHAGCTSGRFFMPRAANILHISAARRNFAVNAANSRADGGPKATKQRSTKASRQAKHAKQPALQQLCEKVSVMPGVGPKYASLLEAHQIRTVADLMKVHMQAHGRQMNMTQKFLKETVGINNSGCLRSMTEYMAQKSVELEQAVSSSEPAGQGVDIPSWLQPKVTLSVEGNISAGKSTFLRILENKGLLHEKLQVVQEPVDQWQNVGNGKVNLLMEFYKAPERFAYTFQNYVFLTRMMQERQSYTAAAMCRLLERSVFSDKMVFVRSVHEARYMTDTELAIYNSWFDPVLSTLPTLVPNGFIYLRAQPETCYKRLNKRARAEESTVQLEYLENLHDKHEDWLVDGGDALESGSAASKYLWVEPTKQVLTHSKSVPPQSVAGGTLYPGMHFSIHGHAPTNNLVTATRLPPVPSKLNKAIRFLDTSRGEHMHPLLHTVPALVLDCDEDVDVQRDEHYKAHIAEQVSLYCDYVRQYMVARGDVVVQQEKRLANGSNGYASQDGVYFTPGGSFSGYSLDVKGTTLYLDPKAPLIAYASPESRDIATSQKGQSSLILPDSMPGGLTMKRELAVL